MGKVLTHPELCDLCVAHAVRRGAVLVTSEKGDSEKPDVFALFPDGTTVVYECKASRADFRADADKPFRKNPSEGMGNERIYVVNIGVCKPWEVPDGWRLAYALGLNRLQMAIPCIPVGKLDKDRLYRFEHSSPKELELIASAIASGGPLVPEGFDIRVVRRNPSSAKIAEIKSEGRCCVCRTACGDVFGHPAESFGCTDFVPDYRKIFE